MTATKDALKVEAMTETEKALREARAKAQVLLKLARKAYYDAKPGECERRREAYEKAQKQFRESGLFECDRCGDKFVPDEDKPPDQYCDDCLQECCETCGEHESQCSCEDDDEITGDEPVVVD